MFADYGKAQTDAGVATAASADAVPLEKVLMPPPQPPAVALDLVLEPGDPPLPLFLLNSILRI